MSLLQMSFAGAVMILAIIVIRALAINLLPKKTFLVLWGIAVMRLLLPFSIPSAFSVYSLIGNHAPTVNPAKGPQAVGMLPTEIAGQMTVVPNSSSNTASPISMWVIVWTVGMLVCALVFAAAYWKCRQEFHTSLPVDNDFIKGWLSSHRLKRVISVRQSSRFSAPLTYGVSRPVILMPTSTDWENTKSLQYVLTHEYVHIRRFDSVTKLVLIAVLCVHWFNPLVWTMYILANRDIELSCDEAVVRLFGESTKAAYARSLISMEETRSGLTPLCNNFNKNAIEERITAIMKYRKTSIISLVLALALIFGVTTAFATSASANGDADISTSAPTGFGVANYNDSIIPQTDTAEIQAPKENPFGMRSPETDTSIVDGASVSTSVASFSDDKSTKTSIAAQSTISYSFGSGENKTFYEKDTEIELIIQCAYSDIPLDISLVSVSTSELVESHRVESNEQTMILLTVPADGEYFVNVKNESLSRTQEYSYTIAR